MTTTLYIAEKGSAGADIAKALGITSKNKDGFYEQEALGRKTIITWAQGHYITLKEPAEIDERFKKWTMQELPIVFDVDTSLKVIEGKEKAFALLKKYINATDIIVNAGDAGREGELIQRWIIKMAGGSNKRVYRLWTSTLTNDAIVKANQNLIPSKSFDNLYEAGQARAVMDAFLGFNYSRAISLTKTDGVTVSYGRCQSPLLNAIVKRDLEIESFKPEPFFYIKANLLHENIDFSAVMIDEKQQRAEFTSQEAAKDILDKLTDKRAFVKEIVKKAVNTKPPKPYNLLTLQKEMANKYGYDADETLNICQKLYDIYKILSYPRTDSQYLSTDLKDEIKEHLFSLSFGDFKKYVSKAAMADIPNLYYNDKHITDHHALIPVIRDDVESIYYKLGKAEKNVFDAVCKRFISLFFPEYKKETTNITFDINGYLFLSSGSRDISLGFKELYEDKSNPDETHEQSLPVLEEKAFVGVQKISGVDAMTKPKKRYTTSSILTLMEMYKIGTGATQATIIKELTVPKGRNKEVYVKKEKSSYISTDFGRKIISLVPDKLKDLTMLSKLDKELSKIEEGKLDKDDFFENLLYDLNENIEEMKSTAKVELTSPKPQRKTTTFVCPLCGKPLVEHSKGYGCSGYYDKSCSFFLFNTKGSKKIPQKEILNLLSLGKTNEIKGFKAKSGKSFNTKLHLVDGKVLYEFQIK